MSVLQTPIKEQTTNKNFVLVFLLHINIICVLNKRGGKEQATMEKEINKKRIKIMRIMYPTTTTTTKI